MKMNFLPLLVVVLLALTVPVGAQNQASQKELEAEHKRVWDASVMLAFQLYPSAADVTSSLFKRAVVMMEERKQHGDPSYNDACAMLDLTELAAKELGVRPVQITNASVKSELLHQRNASLRDKKQILPATGPAMTHDLAQQILRAFCEELRKVGNVNVTTRDLWPEIEKNELIYAEAIVSLDPEQIHALVLKRADALRKTYGPAHE